MERSALEQVSNTRQSHDNDKALERPNITIPFQKILITRKTPTRGSRTTGRHCCIHVQSFDLASDRSYHKLRDADTDASTLIPCYLGKWQKNSQCL